MTQTPPPNKYPIFDGTTRANPQAVYEQMRQQDPIWMGTGPMTGNHFWFFTEYDDVVAVLKDQRFGKNARKGLPPQLVKKYMPVEPDPTFQAINQHLLNLDQPDHTRLRNLVHTGFTPRNVQALLPRIEAIAQDLLDKMAQNDETDLINAFAFPLPITVIAEMLGVHPEMRDKFREWTHKLLFGMDEEAGRYAVLEFVQYVNELIEVREKEAQDDILSALVRAEIDGDSMDRMELLSMVFLLLVAGHETTVNLIGNGMLALFQHPDQMRLLRDDLSLIDSAVEEMLRWNGPVETPTTRWAFEDIDFKGHTIKQGDVVLPSLLAANRDPNVFENPNIFDIKRTPNKHIAFGHGIHFCLGAPLARMEGTIAVRALLERYPDIAINIDTSKLVWNESLLLHGMKALPVKLR
jgi:cytochrome P450